MLTEESLLYRCQNLSFRYRLGTTWVKALNQISLSIPRNHLTTLSGPSGSGKSTLLSVLGLIEPVQTGEVQFGKTSLSQLSEADKNQIRRAKLGFIFQQFLLFDTLTAEENVSYFLKHLNLSKSEKKKRTLDALESVGLKDHQKKRPLEMSGGQRQRVAIARALVKEPTVIIADEPTASLDQATGESVMNILSQLVREQRASVIVASHDPMALSYSTFSVKLSDGQILSSEAITPTGGVKS